MRRSAAFHQYPKYKPPSTQFFICQTPDECQWPHDPMFPRRRVSIFAAVKTRAILFCPRSKARTRTMTRR